MKYLRKATIWILVILAGIYFVKTLVFGSKSKDNEEVTVTTSQTLTSPQPDLPAEAPPVINPTVVEGWSYPVQEDGYGWVTPNTTKGTTSELPIKWHNTTYNIVTTCVQQFKLEDGSVVSFKADVEKSENFLETPTGSGIFSETAWTKAAYNETWKKTLSVSFRPLYGQELNLRVGRNKIPKKPSH